MIKKCRLWLLRLLVVLGLLSFLYRPWQEVLPVELILFYFLLTSDELALKWLGRYYVLVELLYLFIFPMLIWYYGAGNEPFWVISLAIVWPLVPVHLWKDYYKR